MQRRVTIKDVARQLGVSHTTISRALRGDPGISEQTRNRTREAASRLGYVPHPAGAALATGKTFSILFIVPFRLDTSPRVFDTDVLEGLVEAVSNHGYSVTILLEASLRQRRQTVLQALSPARADGAVLLSTGVNESALEHRSFSLPVVIVNQVIEGSGADFVVCDEWRGAFTATQHLVEPGRHDIAHITGPSHFYPSVQRLGGYRDCLLAHGIPFEPDLVEVDEYTLDGGYRAAKRLLAKGARFSGLFCAGDIQAVGAMKALREQGLRMPEDVAVVGFGDAIYADLITPSLTTIRKPRHLMGKTAGQILVERLNGAASSERVIRQLGTELVVRASSSPALRPGGDRTQAAVLGRTDARERVGDGHDDSASSDEAQKG